MSTPIALQTILSLDRLTVRKYECIGIRSVEDFQKKQILVSRGNYKCSIPIGLLIEETNYYAVTFPEADLYEKEIHCGDDAIRLSRESSGLEELTSSKPEHRQAIELLLRSLIMLTIHNELGFELPANVRTVTGRSAKQVMSNRKDPVEVLVLKHRYFSKGKLNTKEVTYKLCEALDFRVEFIDNGKLLIFLYPRYEVYRDDFVYETRDNLPQEVVEEWSKYWRLTGKKVLELAKKYIPHILRAFKNHGIEVEQNLAFDKKRIVRLDPPRFKFGSQIPVILPDNKPVHIFIREQLKREGPVCSVPDSLRVLPVIDNVESKSPPKGFSDWFTAFKNVCKIIKSRLEKGKYSLFHIPKVEILAPVYAKGDPDLFWKTVKNYAVSKNVDVVLYIINSFEEGKTKIHDIAKRHLDQIGSQCVKMLTVRNYPPKGTHVNSFLNIPSILIALGVFYDATKRLAWTIDDERFDVIMGIDVMKILRGKYFWGAVMTIAKSEILMESIGGPLAESTEEIPATIISDHVEELLRKWASIFNYKKKPKRILFIRDGFRISGEIEALKDVIDRLKWEKILPSSVECVYTRINKSFPARLVDKTTLDTPGILGQPKRGEAFILEDTSERGAALIITTGYPDIKSKDRTRGLRTGLSRPLYVEVIYKSPNFSGSLIDVLTSIYWRTYLRVESTRQIRVPIEIVAAEDYMEWLNLNVGQEG